MCPRAVLGDPSGCLLSLCWSGLFLLESPSALTGSRPLVTGVVLRRPSWATSGNRRHGAGRQRGKKVSTADKVKKAGSGVYLRLLGTTQGGWDTPWVADFGSGLRSLEGSRRMVSIEFSIKTRTL